MHWDGAHVDDAIVRSSCLHIDTRDLTENCFQFAYADYMVLNITAGNRLDRRICIR